MPVTARPDDADAAAEPNTSAKIISRIFGGSFAMPPPVGWR